MSGRVRGPGGKGRGKSSHAALLPRYRELRQVALPLNNRLMDSLPKSVMDEGGKGLGILHGNVLTLDAESVLPVFADHCIYDVLRKGANGVERYLAKSPPPEDSDEMVLLRAMREARFTLLVVEGAEPGVGIEVRDLLRDETMFLVDVGLSQTIRVGTVVASRIMAPEGIAMTTGAALPLGVLPPADRNAVVELLQSRFKQADFRQLTPQEASELATITIRMALEHGAAEHINYLEPGKGRGRGRTGPVSRQRPRTGRDEP
jgi:hypothetical protein